MVSEDLSSLRSLLSHQNKSSEYHRQGEGWSSKGGPRTNPCCCLTWSYPRRKGVPVAPRLEVRFILPFLASWEICTPSLLSIGVLGRKICVYIVYTPPYQISDRIAPSLTSLAFPLLLQQAGSGLGLCCSLWLEHFSQISFSEAYFRYLLRSWHLRLRRPPLFLSKGAFWNAALTCFHFFMAVSTSRPYLSVLSHQDCEILKGRDSVSFVFAMATEPVSGTKQYLILY